MTRNRIAARTALVVLAGVPAVGRADILFLDYEGAVTSIDVPENDRPESTGYTIGEPVKGELTIDTQRVMPPLGGTTGSTRSYEGFPTGEQDFTTNFINGFFGPESEESISATDGLTVRNYPNGSMEPDAYLIRDDNDWGKGWTLSLDVIKHDLLQDNGIVQAFDLRSEDVRGPGESLAATIWAGADDWFVRAVLNHVSLRVGRCEQPT